MASVVLVLVGFACSALGVLLAFTPYGFAALVVGAGSAGAGMVLLLVREGQRSRGRMRPR